MKQLEPNPGLEAAGLCAARDIGGAAPFRGEIWDNAARFRLIGKAYESMPAEQHGYFDIATCRHLAGPMLAWRHPDIRKILVRKAIQTQGSLLIDLILPFIIEHDPRNTLVLFESEEKALNYCSVRLMDTLHQHPVIGGMIQEVKREKRDDVTTTYIKLPGMTLLVGGLNESNVSTLSWPNVLISEAWIHKDDGLLFKAFGRATQFESSCKILVESQAGMEGEDFARECGLAMRIPLTWACPFCEKRQEWEFSQKRPDEFKPVSRMQFAEGYLPMQSAPKSGTYAGMIIPHSTRLLDGVETELSADERALGSEWECYHCGSRLSDQPKLRRQLMESYRQDIPEPAPRSVLFDWPEEASLGISFAESVRHFLSADAAQKLGNIVPKQDWYMQRRARTWDPELMQRSRPYAITAGSYETDPAKRSFGDQFHCRQMTVDCGKALDADTGDKRIGTFWFEVRDWDKRGNSRQLARGFVGSWELLAAQQRHWKVPCARTFVDSGWMPSQVEEAAVRFFELEPISPLMQVPRTWRLMLGAGSGRRLTVNNKGVAFLENKLPGIRTAHDRTGKLWRMWLFKLTWANFWFEQQFESIIGGGVAVEWGILPSEKIVVVDLAGKPDEKLLAQSLAMEGGRRGKHAAYQDQLQSRYYSDKTKKYEDYEKQSRPTEYRDCALMQLVGVAADGLLGHIAPPMENSTQADG